MRGLLLAIASLALVACHQPPRSPESSPEPEVVHTSTDAETAAPAKVAQDPEPVHVVRRQSRIDIDVEDAPLGEVMDQIGREVGWNILVDPQVNEKVTVSLRGVYWRDAVDIIAKMTRCDVVEVRPGTSGL